MTTIEYVDVFQDLVDEAGSYFEEHFKGCEEHLSSNELLEVNAELFQKHIDAGVANVFKIKDEEELVGYLNVSISPSLILASTQAVVDFLYVYPNKRNKGYAASAIASVEEELKEGGISRLTIMLPEKQYSSSVAEGLGYTKSSSIYNKYIGDK